MERPPFEFLEVLIAVAESKNFLEAAKRLGVSQPAITFKLKRLQAQVPLPVFTLQGKKKVLTTYGRELYQVAKIEKEQLDRKYEFLNRRFVEAEDLTLRIGCRRELFEYFVSSLIFEGRIEHLSLSGHNALLHLLEHKIDIAITYEKPDSTEVIARKVLESGCVFVIHRKLLRGNAKLASVVEDPEFLRNTRAVFYQSDGHLIKEWVGALGLKVSELKACSIAQDWRTIQALVDGGFGFGIVPDYIKSSSKAVMSFPLAEKVLPKYRFYALFRKDLLAIPAFGKILRNL